MAADTVIVSNHVFDSVSDTDRPAAIVVAGEKIEAVVAPDAYEPYCDASTRVIDAGDAFVCPGFHDAHQHVMHAALFPSALATEYPGVSEQDCVNHMADFARTRPWGQWLVSHGWRSMLWDPTVEPTRLSLDAQFPDRPVAMYSGDSHTLWTNTQGLRELGIGPDTQPPEGGSFVRDEKGWLTGVLREAAGMYYVAKALDTLPEEDVAAAYKDYFAMLNRQGVTSVCDMGLSSVPGADAIHEDIYRAMEAAGDLTLRAHLFPSLPLDGDTSRIHHLQETLDGPYLRAPGVKQFFDGVSSAHTAWLLEPYANPYFEGDAGHPTIPSEKMAALVERCASEHVAIRIHAIGDRAVHEAIAHIGTSYARHGAPVQGANCLEHIENLLESDVTALKDAHIVASVQPQHITIDVTQPDRDLGPERASYMWPFRDYIDEGVTVAFGTDAPCVPMRVWEILHDAVTRRTSGSTEPPAGFIPSQRISMQEAIKALTAGSAKAVGRGDELGTLEAGKYADLVVVAQNLLTMNPELLRTMRVELTMVGGRVVYEAGQN
jgi:hypothetical protein